MPSSGQRTQQHLRQLKQLAHQQLHPQPQLGQQKGWSRRAVTPQRQLLLVVRMMVCKNYQLVNLSWFRETFFCLHLSCSHFSIDIIGNGHLWNPNVEHASFYAKSTLHLDNQNDNCRVLWEHNAGEAFIFSPSFHFNIYFWGCVCCHGYCGTWHPAVT